MQLKYEVVDPGYWAPQNLNPILFLHALADSRKTWRKVAPVIVNKTGRKAYLLDARNHGESPRSKEMTLQIFVQDVLDFMKERAIEKAIIVGHSIGGRTGINLALKHSEKVEALIVEDMTPKNVRSDSKTLVMSMHDILKDFFESIPTETDLNTARSIVLKYIVEFIDIKYARPENSLGNISTVNDEDTSSRRLSGYVKFENGLKNGNFDLDMIPITKVGGAIMPEVNIQAAKAMLMDNPLVEDLPKQNFIFNGDALFLCADSGFFNLEKDSSIKKLFPKASIKKFKDASHLIHIDSPKEFAEVISDFILHRSVERSKY